MLGALVYVAILATLTFLTMRAPQYALVAVVCMFGLDQLGQLYIPFLQSNGLFTNLYVLLLAGAAIAVAYFSGTANFGIQLQNCGVRNTAILLIVFAFLSLAWSRVDGMIYWAPSWPYLVLSLVMAPMLINKIEDLEQVQDVLVYVGGVLTVFLAFVPDWGARSISARPGGEEIALPLALAQLSGYLLITGAIRVRKSHLSIGWLILVVFAALSVAIKSGSRGQLIFSILSLAFVTPFIWKHFTLKNVLQLALAGSVIVFVSSFILDTSDTYTRRWELAEMLEDLEGRFDMARILLSEWIASPIAILFGLGNSSSFSEDLVGVYPHIVILEVLGEEGIVGLALFVTMASLMARQAMLFKKLHFLSQKVRKVYAVSFGCFLFTFLLSFKQGSLITTPMMFFFAVTSERYFYLIKRALYQSAYRAEENIELAKTESSK